MAATTTRPTGKDATQGFLHKWHAVSYQMKYGVPRLNLSGRRNTILGRLSLAESRSLPSWRSLRMYFWSFVVELASPDIRVTS